jgi:myo-inositol 2-dehydrogenase/D-chiro-inositol 1-dehydrogenase
MATKHLAAAVNRRDFISRALGVAAVTSLTGSVGNCAEEKPQEPKPVELSRKIKLGVIGNGGRGGWITGLFKNHGGYEIHAVADYFQEVADACGDAHGVDKARRFSGLSGYKKLIESGVEAVVLETPPYFMPEHAKAAVDAGLHVYMAKPVAVDVPGAMQILAAGKLAGEKKRVFLVDYQLPTDPVNIEVRDRIKNGGIDKIVQVSTMGTCNGFGDPQKTTNIESRLRGLVWVNDVALGCDLIGNYDIHAIDAALWILGERPVVAMGSSKICRPDPHGDARDVCSVVYEYASGIVHNHYGQALANGTDPDLSCRIHGLNANATVHYYSKSFLRGGPKHFGGGQVVNLYGAGVERNIASFYKNVMENKFENETLQRAVDGVLTCILGREAASRKCRLTMDELIKENKRLEVDLSGLRA